MDKKQLLTNLYEADKYFSKGIHQKTVQKAWHLWNTNASLKSIQETLKQLPSDKQLLSKLIEKLKGKSVYTTLKRVKTNSGNIKEAKALSSLLTHALISVEQGEIEFKKLLPVLLSKINDKVYEVISK